METISLKEAARRGWRRVVVESGGLGNGRSERNLTIKGRLRGHLVVEQGLTSDQIFVSREQEEAILVSRR